MMSYEVDFHKVRPWPEHRRDMHICPDPQCHAEMTQPVWWEYADENRNGWLVQIYCGECQSFFQGTFKDEEQIDNYDELVDENLAKIRSELDRIGQQNMEQYVHMFEGALQAGQIYPEDF